MRFDSVSKYSKFRGKFCRNKPRNTTSPGVIRINHVFEAVIFYSNVIAEPDPRQLDHMKNKKTLKTDKYYVGY